MSKGLGKMQRLIVDELRNTRGGVWIERPWSFDVDCPAGVYDLREVSQALARRHGGISHCHFTSPAWQASFSRAVRGLVNRGLIETDSASQRRFVRKTQILITLSLPEADGTDSRQWFRDAPGRGREPRADGVKAVGEKAECGGPVVANILKLLGSLGPSFRRIEGRASPRHKSLQNLFLGG